MLKQRGSGKKILQGTVFFFFSYFSRFSSSGSYRSSVFCLASTDVC